MGHGMCSTHGEPTREEIALARAAKRGIGGDSPIELALCHFELVCGRGKPWLARPIGDVVRAVLLDLFYLADREDLDLCEIFDVATADFLAHVDREA